MPKRPAKTYAVQGGRDAPYALYRDWPSTSRAVHGQKGVRYKSFPEFQQALSWLGVPLHQVHLAPVPAVPAAASAAADEAKGPLEIWTDGGCDRQGTPEAQGGVGVYWGPAHPHNLAMTLPGAVQTNNRAELWALLEALLAAPADRDTVVHSDSTYALGVVRRLDAGKPAPGPEAPHADLVAAVRAVRPLKPRVRCVKVKGHAGVAGNEGADALATEGVRRAAKRRRVDAGDA